MASESGLFVDWFEQRARKKKRVNRKEVGEENETSGSPVNNDDTEGRHASDRHTGRLTL